MRSARLVSAAALLMIGASPLVGTAMARPFGATEVAQPAKGEYLIRWDKDGLVDVYVAATPDASLKKARRLADNDKDGSLAVRVSNISRPYFILRSESDGSIVRTAQRLLPLEHSSNFRDIGGYPAVGGKHVRWGKIFRSGGMPLLSKADNAYLSKLRISTIVDLRTTEESELAPTNWKAMAAGKYYAPTYDYQQMSTWVKADDPNPVETSYREIPTVLVPHLKTIFARLLAGNEPLLYNCTAGQDRTGFTTAMILSALGVPRDAIYADYKLSPVYRRAENEVPRLSIDRYAKTNPMAKMLQEMVATKGEDSLKPTPLVDQQGVPFLAIAFNEIEKNWGSVDHYLATQVVLSPIDVASLRAMYLE